MAYTISKFDGTSLVTISDGVVDTDSTSLSLVGKNVVDYGTVQNDNFVWLVENFSATTPPPHQLKGQIWFDKNEGVLKPKIYDGGYWRTIGITEIGDSQPGYLQPGDLWFDTANKQLWVKSSSGFQLVGPELVQGYDSTKWSSGLVKSSSNLSYPVTALVINGQYIMVTSDVDFDVDSSEVIYQQGISHIYKGLTLKDENYALHGYVEDSRYSKLSESEVVTGSWSFTNALGIKIGSQSSQANIKVDSSSNLVLEPSSNGSLILSSENIRPSINNAANLGSASYKFGSVYTTVLSAGSTISEGSLVGQWTTSGKFSPTSDNQSDLGLSNKRWNIYSASISSGAENASGTITGQWSLSANSKIISPVVQTPLLSTGNPTTAGQYIGNWTPAPGSTLQATSVLSSTGGALDANTEAIGNTVAQRTSNGSLKAVAFIGNLTGNVTGNVTGDLTGSLTGPSSGTHTGPSAGTHTGPVVGAVTGNVTGNLTGNVTSTSISAGSDTTVGNISGFWKFNSSSKLQLNYLTAGDSYTSGIIQGNWRLTTGSRLQATDLVDIDANAVQLSRLANPLTVVQRTQDGSIYANKIYADIIGSVGGNADFAGTATRTQYSLAPGSYITGSAFNGSVARTWDINATSANTVNTIVARDANGNFNAGTISVGTVTASSNVSAATVNASQALSTNGPISGASVSVTGDIKSTGGGSITGAAFVASGAVTAASVSASGAVSAASVSASGAVSAASVSVSGTVSAGQITTVALSTGAPTTGGTVTGSWTLTSGSRMQATYADVAEKYQSDIDYEPGTVVMFGGDKEVTISQGYMNQEVAGIVSTNPAHLLNSDIDGIAIALTGRVPCKVVGKIKKGALLISSNVAGVATSSHDPRFGSVIAKAMNDYNSSEVGIIEVMVWRG